MNSYSNNPSIISPHYKVTFGKYKYKTALEVYEDKDYCSWLNSNNTKNLIPLLRCLKTKEYFGIYQKENPISNISDYKLDFGKYKGKLISEVYNDNYDYCEWILTTPPNLESLYEKFNYAKHILKKEI